MLPAVLLLLLVLVPIILSISFKLDSRKECSDEISKALNNKKYYVIGLYGSRGSGKSALLKSKLKEYEKYFSRVFYFEFPNVSKNQDIKNIQEQIANKLKFCFERHHTHAQRVSMINSKLISKGETTLIILDGLPTMYKLRDLGIPYRRKGFMVLLTTRNKVDCISMGCNRSIRLNPLYRDEAFELLKNLSGFRVPSPLFGVALEVSSKCNGSPGLIKDVVSSLKSKSIEKWKETSVSLSHSTARYQIFLNFRGEDTRGSFTRPLYQSLCSEGFETYMDEESLDPSARIHKLLDDIEESRSAIVILSESYANSEWTLRELVKILDCQKRKNQLVLPVFYGVEPTDIRNLKGKFGEAMAEIENKFGKDSNTIHEWKQALRDISYLKGEPCHVSNLNGEQDIRIRDQLIEKIVRFARDQRHRLHIQSMYMN